jgi:transcriptional regulator with XRE-family HTH domain
MGNNLKHYIKLAGMSNSEVAAKKGIAPESVSRHVTGRSQMSIRDAIEYANILDCTPESLLFETQPIDVIGRTTGGYETELFDTSQIYQARPIRSFTASCRLLERIWPTHSHLGDAFTLIDAGPMKSKTVPNTVYGSPAIAKYIDHDGQANIAMVMIFPMPDNKFTVQGVYETRTVVGVSIEWACPILVVIQRPELLGWDYQKRN